MLYDSMANKSKFHTPYIFFDAGNVLVYKIRTEGQNIMADLGLPYDDYESLISEVVAWMGPAGNGYDQIRTYEDEVHYLNKFHRAMLRYLHKETQGQVDEDLVHKFTTYRTHGHISLMKGARELLEYCKAQSIPMGILSNAPPSRRDIDLKNYMLDEYFQTIIISAEEGTAKPHSDIYVLATDRAKVNPADVVFIDDKEIYLDGAYRAGWGRLIRLTSTSQDPSKYETVDSLSQLKDVLEHSYGSATK